MTSRLFTKYKEEVLPRLQKQFNYKNIMQTPGLVKVVVNIGVNEAKIDMLGVHNNTLERFGAVSEEVAKEMSEGTLTNAIHSCCAISTTGIAGPTGGTESKPVGMVCFAFSRRIREGVQTSTCTQYFTGSRAEVRASAVAFALTKAIKLFGQD